MKERVLTNWLRKKEGYLLIAGHALSQVYDDSLRASLGRPTGHTHYSHSLSKAIDAQTTHVISFLNLEKIRPGFSLFEGKAVEVLGARMDGQGEIQIGMIRAIDIFKFEKELKAGRTALEIFEKEEGPAPLRRNPFRIAPWRHPQIR